MAHMCARDSRYATTEGKRPAQRDQTSCFSLLSFHAGLHKSSIVQEDFQEREKTTGLFCSSPQPAWEIYRLEGSLF